MTQATPTPPKDTRPTVAFDPVFARSVRPLDPAIALEAGKALRKVRIETVHGFKERPADTVATVLDSYQPTRDGGAQFAGFLVAAAVRAYSRRAPLPVIPDLRIAALESALNDLVDLLLPSTVCYDDSSWNYDDEVNAKAAVILDRVGLAHHLDGNPADAEQVTA